MTNQCPSGEEAVRPVVENGFDGPRRFPRGPVWAVHDAGPDPEFVHGRDDGTIATVAVDATQQITGPGPPGQRTRPSTEGRSDGTSARRRNRCVGIPPGATSPSGIRLDSWLVEPPFCRPPPRATCHGKTADAIRPVSTRRVRGAEPDRTRPGTIDTSGIRSMIPIGITDPGRRYRLPRRALESRSYPCTSLGTPAGRAGATGAVRPAAAPRAGPGTGAIWVQPGGIRVGF